MPDASDQVTVRTTRRPDDAGNECPVFGVIETSSPFAVNAAGDVGAVLHDRSVPRADEAVLAALDDALKELLADLLVRDHLPLDGLHVTRLAGLPLPRRGTGEERRALIVLGAVLGLTVTRQAERGLQVLRGRRDATVTAAVVGTEVVVALHVTRGAVHAELAIVGARGRQLAETVVEERAGRMARRAALALVFAVLDRRLEDRVLQLCA